MTSIKERLTNDESPVKDELKEDPDDMSPVSRSILDIPPLVPPLLPKTFTDKVNTAKDVLDCVSENVPSYPDQTIHCVLAFISPPIVGKDQNLSSAVGILDNKSKLYYPHTVF